MGRFPETNWGEVLAAATSHQDHRRDAIGVVMGQYWKPIYCYIRRRGFDNEKSKDLTQAFLTDVVLGRSLVQKAQPERGRFRAFLLSAVDNFLRSALRAEAARKRKPEGKVLSLDGAESFDLPDPAKSATPEEAFNYAWALSLVEDALAEVESGCHHDGLSKHWEVFQATVTRPILENVGVPPLSDLCASLGIESESRASNMNVTVKRRFRNTLRRLIQGLVQSENQVEQEISDIMEALSFGSAG